MSYVVGGGGVTRNFAAQHAVMRHHQASTAIQANRLLQQNLLLVRSTISEVVHELVEAQPTADELQLLSEVAQASPGQIEARLGDTRLWHLAYASEQE
jgi:hypothetical protein